MLFSPRSRLVYEGSWEPNYLEPARQVYDNELVYVSQGRFVFEINGTQEVLGRGAVVIIPPGVWHESHTTSDQRVTRHCVHFDWLPEAFPASRPLAAYRGDTYEAAWISPVPPDIRALLPLNIRLPPRHELHELIMDMFRWFRRRQEIGEAMLWPVLSLLLALKQEIPAASSIAADRVVLMVRDYIDRHYAERQKCATYCRYVKVSPSHLCRLFVAQMGRTPQAYLIEVRLHHARRLLREGALNINEVGRAVGIPDANYFSRLFRSRFGQSPSAYRTAQMRPMEEARPGAA